jgi:hypothetical protein
MKSDSQERGTIPITRTEAIHQAIVALGASAPVSQILEYVWEHFGIGVPPAASPGSPPARPAGPTGERPALVREPAPGQAVVALAEPSLQAPPPADDLPLETSRESPADPSDLKKGKDRRSRPR